MRLKRRLMVVVRLVTDGAQCKPGASFPQSSNSNKHSENPVSCLTAANLCRHELPTCERARHISAYEDAGNGGISTAKTVSPRSQPGYQARVYLRSSRRNSLLIACQKIFGRF